MSFLSLIFNYFELKGTKKEFYKMKYKKLKDDLKIAQSRAETLEMVLEQGRIHKF